ncbi:MAG: ABC-F family ATP-binding cassette domain-containing protein, partial [Candidatus Thermoplasmatota archaeon]|nr:ABC-F family ATP-binding cassette domain-containing protein [Candidatus Thermoplasmatota archaeon]
LKQVLGDVKGQTVSQFISDSMRTGRAHREIRKFEEKLGDPDIYGSPEYEEILGEYQRLQESIGWAEVDTSWDTVQDLLTELEFENQRSDSLMETLSGGERQKLALASVLANPKECDLLLLDEPTNHLDIDTIEWFEEKLADFPAAIIVISHDRYLLDNLVDRVFEMEGGKVVTFNASYEEYEEQKDIRQHIKDQGYKKARAEEKRQKRSIAIMTRRNKYDSQIKSKLRRLNKVQRYENPVIRSYLLKFQFKSTFKSSTNVADGIHITKSYGRKILDDTNFEISNGQRIGLIGRNGCGKTTLLKIITGEEKPDGGKINLSGGVKWRYFDQGHLSLVPGNTILEEVIRGKEGLRENDAKALLGQFAFKRKSIYNRVERLSGGERARLALLRLLLKPCNLLILDEPTNHMDIPSKTAIAGALNSFDGTVIVVSHDRDFLDNVCDTIFLMTEGRILSYRGNYTAFKGDHLKRFRKVTGTDPIRYVVMKTFTEWSKRKKHRKGEKIIMDEEKEKLYRSAIQNRWLKEI